MKRINLIILLLSIIFINCSKDDDPKLSSENKIISYQITANGEEFNGIINQSTKTIIVTTNNIDLSNPITPKIEISNNATISPSASSSQNFSQNVQYTVTAENGDEAVYNIIVNSSDNKITSFSIKPNQTTFSGVINNSNNRIVIETIGLEMNSTLIPEIEFSQNATISPDPSTAQDFNQDIEYTLTAQNGEQATYTIITNNTPLSDKKKILGFQFEIGGEIFEGIIDNNALTIKIETTNRIANIKPQISISDNASISPNPEELQNFYGNVEYTVTAENNTSNTYKVIAESYEIYNNNPKMFYSNGNGIVSGIALDLSVPNSSLVLENNTNSYILTVLNSNLQVLTAGELFTSHSYSFPSNIKTANDYKIKYKINDKIKVESNFNIDVLAENIPVINSSNQTTYKYGDTMILYGNNLVSGLAIHAHNGNIYKYGENFISVNNNKTELTFPITTNEMMFPSYNGKDTNYPTRLTIIYQGRWGGSYIVDFD